MAVVRSRGRWRLALAGVFAASSAVIGRASAETPFELAQPIGCTVGDTCFIQNYVDQDPSAEARDFRCGPLTYDGHKGTDFRLRNLAAMRAGVDVLAAAAGRVSRIRDGEPDVNVRERGRDAVRGKECGNGVVIAHGQGWQSYYCHMKQGSIAVRPGQDVGPGTVLGQVGISGFTEFPHLHFELRRDGRPIDPFTATAMGQGCGGEQATSLWSPAPRHKLVYQPSGILNAGFTTGRPSRSDIENALRQPESLPPDAPAIVFWIEIFGLREGDIEVCRLLGPSGDVLAEATPERSDRNRATFFSFVGKRRTAKTWPRGRYIGEFRLKRMSGGREGTVLQARREILVR